MNLAQEEAEDVENDNTAPLSPLYALGHFPEIAVVSNGV